MRYYRIRLWASNDHPRSVIGSVTGPVTGFATDKKSVTGFVTTVGRPCRRVYHIYYMCYFIYRIYAILYNMEYIVYITLHIRLNMFVILHHITLHYIILQYASDLGCRRGEPMFHGSVSGSVIGSVIGNFTLLENRDWTFWVGVTIQLEQLGRLH